MTLRILRNILTAAAFAVVLFTANVNAQSSEVLLAKEWITVGHDRGSGYTKASAQESESRMTFLPDHNFMFGEQPSGTWKYDAAAKTILIAEPEEETSMAVLKLDEKSLVVKISVDANPVTLYFEPATP